MLLKSKVSLGQKERHAYLQDERQNGLPPFWVIAELLAVILVLADSPHGHLEHASSCEHVRRDALSHHGEGQPGEELVRVIRARYIADERRRPLKFIIEGLHSIKNSLEQQSHGVGVGLGNLADGRTGGTQIPQIDVNRKVAKLRNLKQNANKMLKLLCRQRNIALTYAESGEGSVGHQLTGWRKLRMVHMVCNVGGKEPIVGTVLEEVPQWHRSMREAMHENCLQQSLDVVDGVANGSDAGREIRKDSFGLIGIAVR